MAKPVIGITCDISHVNNPHKAELNLHYVDMIEQAGGVPVVLVATNKYQLAREQINRVDAVVGVGGDDYHPGLYNQERHYHSIIIPKRRQDHDLIFFSEVFQKQLPALMICGSTQGLNITRGGNLNQHLDQLTSVHKFEKGFSLAHDIQVESDTLLHQVLGDLESKVNSFHHQAIDQLGAGLRVSARATDGTIEAVESVDCSDHPLLAVQWHPERIPKETHSKRLFAWLIDQAAAHRPAISVQKKVNRISPFI